MTEPVLVYLVADGARARLLRRLGDDSFETIWALESPRAAAPLRDERTRVFQSYGARRSAAEAGETPGEAARRAFLAEVAQTSNRILAHEPVHQFFLVAPVRVGSTIRDQLSPVVVAKLKGELHKDLTKAPELELREALKAMSVPAADGS